MNVHHFLFICNHLWIIQPILIYNYPLKCYSYLSIPLQIEMHLTFIKQLHALGYD
jgi:hypothetical protein